MDMMDITKRWLDYYRNKSENKKKYGDDLLPKRPNSSKKAYDSEKIKKHLKEIDRLFEDPSKKLHIFKDEVIETEQHT